MEPNNKEKGEDFGEGNIKETIDFLKEKGYQNLAETLTLATLKDKRDEREERLCAEVMDDYLFHAKMLHAHKNQVEAMEELRRDFEKLKAFIKTEIDLAESRFSMTRTFREKLIEALVILVFGLAALVVANFLINISNKIFHRNNWGHYDAIGVIRDYAKSHNISLEKEV